MIYLAFSLTVVNALIVGYYWALPILGGLVRRRRRALVSRSPFRLATGSSSPSVGGGMEGPSRHRFAILIPAHNEELAIGETLRSCAALDYRRDGYDVFVIADNCTDETASIARAAGVFCLERRNDRERGKGQALAWAFEQLLSPRYDAYLVLDADCWIDRTALQVCDSMLAERALVLQLRNAVANPDASPISFATAVGNAIENDLFYAPKSRLGLAVLLRGTGMVFHREILERWPWTASSNAEDLEYTLNLIASGVEIHFLPQVNVWSDSPENSQQLQIQRKRWASGTALATKCHSLSMMFKGAKRRSLRMFDAGWTLLVLSRPLVIISVLAGPCLAGVSGLFGPSRLSAGLMIGSLSIVGLLVAYFCLGVVRMGLSVRRLGLLLRAPLVVLQLVSTAILGWIGIDVHVWNRTPRNSEALSQ